MDVMSREKSQEQRMSGAREAGTASFLMRSISSRSSARPTSRGESILPL